MPILPCVLEKHVHLSSRIAPSCHAKPHRLPAQTWPKRAATRQRWRGQKASVSDDPAAETTSEGSEESTQQSVQLSRRTLKVTFTCNKCGHRTDRLVNPLAWDKGLVFAQCKGCGVWHKLRDEAQLIDEIVFADEE